MSEHRIRSAFDQLKKEVMDNVRTEERLSQITDGPRLRWRPAVASTGAAAAVLVIGIGLVALLSDGDPNPAPPIGDGTTTTVADGATTVPSQTGFDLGAGTILIAESGVATSSTEGVVVVDADLAVGDGDFGLVVQRDSTILRVAADGSETPLLSAASLSAEFGPVTIQLEDVARIDGTAQALAVVGYGQEYPDIFQEIWLLDLESGATESVYQMVAVESNITRVAAADGKMIVSVSFEGGTYFEYLNTAGQPLDVAGPVLGSTGRFTDFDSPVFEGVLSPEGSEFAYLQIRDVTTGEDGYYLVDLIVWDLVDGVEVQRLEIELREGEFAPWPGRMDYDGAGIVLGRYLDSVDGSEALPPLRIESLADGVIIELGSTGTPSLIK